MAMKSGSALDKLKAAATESKVQNEDVRTEKKKKGKSTAVIPVAPPKQEQDRRMLLLVPTVSIHQALNELTPISVAQRSSIINHLTHILSQDHLFSKAESEFYGGA